MKSPEDPIKILVVDDRQENLTAMEAMLRDFSSSLILASSGEEALRHLLDQEIAVILLDVYMPRMDGFQTAELIRARGKTRHTPIIFVTAMGEDHETIRKAYSLGAVDYIFKPVEPEILRAKVSVFVDLFRKTEEIRRQERLLHMTKLREREREREKGIHRYHELKERERAKEIAEAQVRELEQTLEQTLEQYRALSSAGQRASVTSALMGMGAMRDRAPDLMAELVEQYQEILNAYLDSLVVKKEKPQEDMQAVVTRLGDLTAGPRDLIDLHSAALQQAGLDASPARVRACAVQGRLLALEMMGQLVEYYRTGTRRSQTEGD